MKVSPNIQMIQAQFDSQKLRPTYAHECKPWNRCNFWESKDEQ